MTVHRRELFKLGAGALLSAGGAAKVFAHPSKPPSTSSAEIKTGGIRMIQVDGKYNVWTKKVGHGKIKVLTLHGGPGVTHEYLECFEDFLPQQGIEFYYYDQLGSAYSDQPDDKSLWTVERFREEVEQVRSALGLENFYLFGHSWGGMLGIEYALKYQKHLKALVISDMTASIASYVEYINELRKKLPPDVIAVLEKYEGKGEYEAPEYQDVMLKRVYAEHLCRLDPWPDPVVRTFKHLATPVYNTMQGPNEFIVNGTFKEWDRWNDLPKIHVPTLLLVGRHDTMSVADIQRMGRAIPRSRVAVCENGSHLGMYDDQQTYFRHLLAFFRDVAAGKMA
ncbi:MAG: proline iminopeptidase-family hydrolase [Acidobacteriota bacterium]